MQLTYHNVECNDALEEVKIYGRDPRDASPIFTKEVSSFISSFAAVTNVLRPGDQDVAGVQL